MGFLDGAGEEFETVVVDVGGREEFIIGSSVIFFFCFDFLGVGVVVVVCE